VARADVLAAFEELPVSVRKEQLRLLRVVARNAALRNRVLAVWRNNACAACGLTIRDEKGNVECEVAHLHEVHAEGPDLIANSIPLCRTHHWAFDRNLWAIHPTTLLVHVAPDVSKALMTIHGRKIRRPLDVGDVQPLTTKYLKLRWKRFATSVKRGTPYGRA
jgi:hypothetical protein